MQMRRWLVCSVVAWMIALGAAAPGCRNAAIPIGLNNNTRQSSNVAAATWAQPVEEPGLPNLHKVSDKLYRGAQPTAEGVKRLQALGVRTIINLRTSNTDRNLLTETGPACECIPMTAWHPRDDDVVRFLQIATDESRLPAFVHCRRGADRTGMMVAIYRVAVQGWGKEQAIDEMTHGGFRFNSGWRNLVQYVRDLDIDAIKRRAGMMESTPAK